MALAAAIVWEIRTTGNNNSGGGFKTGATGTDRSQQDAAQLSFTDLQVKNAVYTRIYSVIEDANLDATCVGNVVQVTGDGGSGLFTPGFYEVTAQGNDGNNYLDIDRNCATGNASDGVAALGGAVAGLETIDSVAVKGNTIYIEAGTYTPGVAIDFPANGDVSTHIDILGYNTSRGDNPTGDNRPLLQMAANGFSTGDFNWVRNIRMTTTNTSGLQIETSGGAVNCKVENTGGVATHRAFRISTAIMVDCEAICGNGRGIFVYYTCRVMGCYVHDCNEGIYCYDNADYSVFAFNIIDTCVEEGFAVDSGTLRLTFLNNTIYNCDEGIGFAGPGSVILIMNNLFDSCTTFGYTVTAEYKSNYANYNNWNGNGTDTNNLTKGPDATANVPQFENAAGGDFSLQVGSPCIGAGLAIRLGV